MKILVAPDKFKGSLEAADVCLAAEEGILRAFPDAIVTSIPLADGGEGTAEILVKSTNGSFRYAEVQDPLGRMITAKYGISGDGKTAFIEMAAASGLSLLTREEYNPFRTSTFGTGQLILDAIENGVGKIILGIGGSATTDGGIGMAAALGYGFLSAGDQLFNPNGGSLKDIIRIDTTEINSKINLTSFIVACDVTNPLYGKNGAAYIYGPQKGADEAMVADLDEGLRNLSFVATKTFGSDVSNIPGSGAAGGLGAGALWFLNATLREGASIVMEQTGIENQIQTSDLVITGEGKVDGQTLQGKVVKGLADLCKKHSVPLAVVCGTLEISPEEARQAGITYAVSILNKPTSLAQATTEAFENVKNATFHLVRLFFHKK